MARARVGIAIGGAVLAALALLSGGERADPRTPPALPGLPPPFLGTGVIGNGGRTAAIDSYGNVVGLWAPGPAGRALIDNPVDRQVAGSVPADTGIVARLRTASGSVPLWRADSVEQRYLPGTNVLRTVARFGDQKAVVVRAIGGRAGARSDRRWLAWARPLAGEAPAWATTLYRRSLLVLRALTDRRSGAVAAGARDGWAYVWPRDAAAVALAFAAAGYRPEARRVTRFLLGLDLAAAARFHGDGTPVEGRPAQGDAQGWVAAAARAAGLPASTRGEGEWAGRADYQEGDRGDYLGNALASAGAGRAASAPIRARFATRHGLVREAGQTSSGLDSAAAWAVRPFPQPALFALARRTLLRLAAASGRYGIVPSQRWPGGEDPWTAPTAWTAWALAALARGSDGDRRAERRDRRAALGLMADLRRAATPAGLLPERVDAHSGVPRSTTPLAWSHAFAILALRELWPRRAGS